jgi:hypothetical protein
MMGFCSKHLEAAGQLLMEADRDPGARGNRLRRLPPTPDSTSTRTTCATSMWPEFSRSTPRA